MRRRRWPVSAASALVAAGAPASRRTPIIRVGCEPGARARHRQATRRASWSARCNKEDFEISDNGVPQEVAVFEQQTEQPLSVALMVDTSGSTAKELKYETDSAVAFLRALLAEGNPRGRGGALRFNYEIVKQGSFTHNLQSIERSL